MRASLAAGRRPAPPPPAHRPSVAAAAAPRRVCLLPGDGIGPEITDAAVSVLRAAGDAEGVTFEFETALVGGAAIDAAGSPFPDATLAACRRSEAVLLAAIGG